MNNDVSATSKKDDFDDIDFSRFEENPSWLVDDIATMMDSKKYRYKTPVVDEKDAAVRMNKEIRTLKSKLQPDKNESYANLKKEKASHPHTSDLNEARMQKTKLAMESHLDEATIKEFLNIIQQQNADKARKHVDYMKRSLYRPNPATLPGLPRRWSPTRPRPQTSKIEATSPFASTFIRPLSPPKISRPNSPTIDFHEMIMMEMRAGRKVEVASKVKTDLQLKLLTIMRAAVYFKFLSARAKEYRMLKLKYVRASQKIQKTFRAMRSRSSLKKYLLVPPIFTRFLYRYKRRKALDIVKSFIQEVQSCRTKRIVRRFLMAVKQVQTYVRQYLQVREARVLALSRFWETTERTVRRQIEEQERANYARNEKLRQRRMGKNIHSASIFDKWNLTHHQVEQLYNHINDVDVNRANVIRLNEGGGKVRRAGRVDDNDDDQRNLFMEMCDPVFVRERIEEHILTKRRLHLLAQREAESSDCGANTARLQEAAQQEAQQAAAADKNILTGRKKELRENHYLNLKVVQKVMKDFSDKNSKDLLSRQLAQAGIDVEEEERSRKALKMVAEASSKYKVQKNTMKLENFGRPEVAREGRMFMLKTFFLLTGDLGTSWHQYVEDNVRAEVLRKKKILQRENEIKISESMRTQQDRASLQRQLAYNNKHSNNPFAVGGSLESLSVTSSLESNKDERRISENSLIDPEMLLQRAKTADPRLGRPAGGGKGAADMLRRGEAEPQAGRNHRLIGIQRKGEGGAGA